MRRYCLIQVKLIIEDKNDVVESANKVKSIVEDSFINDPLVGYTIEPGEVQVEVHVGRLIRVNPNTGYAVPWVDSTAPMVFIEKIDAE